MRISEAIKKLEDLMAERGDLELGMYAYNGGDDEYFNVDFEYDDYMRTVTVKSDGVF